MREHLDETNEDRRVVIAGEHDLIVLTALPLGEANGIPTLIELTVGTLTPGSCGGSIRASLYDELWYVGDFRDDLRLLYDTLKGTARVHGEGVFELEIEGDGLGHFLVRGNAVARWAPETRLTFGMVFDQTIIPNLIRSIDRTFLTQPCAYLYRQKGIEIPRR
jgi:hypothetical protein